MIGHWLRLPKIVRNILLGNFFKYQISWVKGFKCVTSTLEGSLPRL